MKKEENTPAPANTPVPATAPAPKVIADPVTHLQNKATNALIGFIRNNPWKAAAMLAAAGLAYALCGRKSRAM